jgi:hypothetical protein
MIPAVERCELPGWNTAVPLTGCNSRCSISSVVSPTRLKRELDALEPALVAALHAWHEADEALPVS